MEANILIFYVFAFYNSVLFSTFFMIDSQFNCSAIINSWCCNFVPQLHCIIIRSLCTLTVSYWIFNYRKRVSVSPTEYLWANHRWWLHQESNQELLWSICLQHGHHPSSVTHCERGKSFSPSRSGETDDHEVWREGEVLEHLLRLLPSKQDRLFRHFIGALENETEENPVQASRDRQGSTVTWLHQTTADSVDQ